MRADRKQALLAAGVELFSRHGYREVSIEEITRGAGVGTGSFYTYFSGKEEFYEEILDGIEEQGRQEVDRLVASFESPLNRLKALYRFATLGIRKNPLLLDAQGREVARVEKELLVSEPRPPAPVQRLRLEGRR